jgi:hypothetical protein
MKSKGQSLDEFHHLAIQRADLTDFKQMYSMRKAASEEGLEWVQPSADQLEWGVWDIVGTAWSLVESTGSDAESSELFQKVRCSRQARALPEGLNTAKDAFACC